jgi:hypothetical protein
LGGYDAESTGLDYDFGGCHTEWFNPVKYGYDCKIIATIGVSTQSIESGGETISVKVLDVRQHAVGSMNMNIPLHFLGSTLYDEPGRVEADDPYNANEEFGFFNIVNWEHKAQFNDNITPLTTNFYTDMLGPADWTARWYDFDSECNGSCKHPFYVKIRAGAEEGSFEYNVCVGSVNNEMLPEGDWSGIPGDGFVVLTCEFISGVFPGTDGVSQNFFTTVPADTDIRGRIAIAHIVGGVSTQLVTGSLWADRIKLGTATATYYFARV